MMEDMNLVDRFVKQFKTSLFTCMDRSNNPYRQVYLYRDIIQIIFGLEIKAKVYKATYYSQIPSLMISEKDKQTKQLLKHINQANRAIDQWAQCFGDKILQYLQNQDQQGLVDIGKLAFQQETNPEIPPQQPSFFSQIPYVHIDQQTEQRITNFKLNYVTARRKDQLFRRYRKQQQQNLVSNKKKGEKNYVCKLENLRGIKGEFILKKREQVHTCSITGEDLEKLKPQTDLNDTIIANYLKYLQTQVFSQQLDKNMFIYSTFFIQKLIGQLLRQDVICTQKDLKFFNERMKAVVTQNYKKIKRWTRRVDIFEQQYLIIPINAFKHWYCLIVVNPGCLIQPKPGKKPYIANCDSMFEKRSFIIDAVRMYLQVELQDKKSRKIQISQTNFPSYQLILPRQTNTHDCGLYMLTYIQHLLSSKNQLDNLDSIKNRQKLHLFPRNLIYSMRERLKQLFILLIQTSDQNASKQILRKYKDQTEKIVKEADQGDYDRINLKQLRKYQSMNSYLYQNGEYKGTYMSEQQLQYACKIKFYLDPQINYYQRDKPLLM